MKNIIAFCLLYYCVLQCSAQFNNKIWCFGDSAKVDFNTTLPTYGTSGMKTRGSSASIADSSGNLLFYCNTLNYPRWLQGNQKLGEVWNKNDSLMENGEFLVGESWYSEIAIVPFPDDPQKFYILQIGTTWDHGVYYSVVDLSYNLGLGKVTQKNIMLFNHPMFDCLDVLKHGNGRDWWVVTRPSDFQAGDSTNEFVLFFISPNSIQGPIVQTIGALNSSNGGSLSYSHSGNKIAFVNYRGLIEIYDFDRCTGIISNPVNIAQEFSGGLYPYYIGCEFSHNDSVLYVSSTTLPSVLLQYDLGSGNISASVQTIASLNYPEYCGGSLRLAPDKKIYWSCAWSDGFTFNYPYPDTTYNTYNMNLSVINQPDSLGTACDFQPFSFYLGGKRTYYGLPNNPNYNMSAWGGSICDTLGLPNHVNTISFSSSNSQLNIFYHSGWQTAFINAEGLQGEKYSLSVFNLMGQKVFEEQGHLAPPSGSAGLYFTKDLSCSALARGMYIITLQTEREILSEKFLKE